MMIFWHIVPDAPQPARDPHGAAICRLNQLQLSIRPFTKSWIPEVRAFNQRMIAGGLKPEMAFPEDPDLEFPTRGAPIWQEPFLATEDTAVHGGYYFTHERYAVCGGVRWIANYRHPISEVVVNKAYKGLGSLLSQDAHQRQPLLYSLGLGGERAPVLLRLRAEGWSSVLIPFYARVVRPAVFLRQIAALRKTPLKRFICDFAAATGLGWLGLKTLQTAGMLRGGSLPEYSAGMVPGFEAWADELWEINRPLHLFAAVRDRDTLNLRYPAANSRFRRLRVSAGGRTVGWAVLLVKQMNRSPYFGDMRVGTIVDCLAAPGHELAVARLAAHHLEGLGVDLLVTNQSSASWTAAFARSGFFSGPSNYVLALSPDLTAGLAPLDRNMARFHVNRGDGAGISRL